MPPQKPVVEPPVGGVLTEPPVGGVLGADTSPFVGGSEPRSASANLVQSTMNVAGNAGAAITQPIFHPLDFLASVSQMPVNIIHSHMQEGQKAYDAFQRGDRTEGTLRGIASIIPLVGPMLSNYAESDQAGKEKMAGDVIGGLATGAGAASAPETLTSMAAKLSERLKGSAIKSEASALGATGMDARATALDLAPEILKRGIKGSREEMLRQAQSELTKTGAQMDAEIAKATQAGQSVSKTGVRSSLQTSMDRMMTTDAKGNRVPIAGLEPRIEQLRKLDEFVNSLPDDIPVEQAKSLKTVYGKIADEAGMYGVNASEVEKAKGWASSQLQSSLRRGLAQNASLAELDKEYGFWKRMEDVLDPAVLKEKTTGGPSIMSRTGAAMVTGAAAGGSVGFALGGAEGATIGSVVGPSIAKLIESPYWKTTVSAPLKEALADAIAAKNYPRVTAVTQSIVNALPANARSLFIAASGAATGAANVGLTGNTGRMGGPGGR